MYESQLENIERIYKKVDYAEDVVIVYVLGSDGNKENEYINEINKVLDKHFPTVLIDEVVFKSDKYEFPVPKVGVAYLFSPKNRKFKTMVELRFFLPNINIFISGARKQKPDVELSGIIAADLKPAMRYTTTQKIVLTKKQMLENLFKEIVESLKLLISGKPLLIGKSFKEKRLDICKTCPHFVPESSRCAMCGCYMKYKAALASSTCPMKKW
jgi:hypothetical protein